MSMFLPCLYAFAACIGFCIIFNIRGKTILYASLGGSLGWLVYLLFAGSSTDIFQYFMASIVISVYSEIMARICKIPSTCFLLVALLPLVPGGGVYYTMEHCIVGDNTAFVETGLHTLGIAGAMAMGVLLVSSMMRMLQHAFSSLISRRKKVA